jgi:molybdenum cofactor cytidylyltransferase
MTSLIILAAGESSRLGRPKQNLVFNGKTLLQHAVDSGLESECENIFVVLGANSNEIIPVEGASIIYNQDWKEGVASSIRRGITEVMNTPAVDRIILMLCDQPFVSAALLNALISTQSETGKPIVACTYNHTIGVPVLFNRDFFPGLLLLQGSEGAKKLLKNYPNDIATILFEQGVVDIDTLADYEKLRNRGD